MVGGQTKLRELAHEIGELSREDRARLLARLLAQEGKSEDWSFLDAIRARNAARSSRDVKTDVERAMREVRSARRQCAPR